MDYFFVHNQGDALRKLFNINLRIQIDFNDVDLMVKFGVAKYQEGNLTPRDKIASVIKKSVKSSTPLVMDISHLASRGDLNDMKFFLGNKGCLQMLCSQINESQSFFQNVQALYLVSNEITSLEPFKVLKNPNLRVINLQFNKIESIEEFSYLNHLKINELFVIGNPVIRTSQFMDKIKMILPNLKKVDKTNLEVTMHRSLHLPSLNFDNRSENITHFNPDATVVRAVDADAHTKNEFAKYKNESWNKVIVEHNGKVSKEIILREMNEQFFDNVSFFPRFFPCYYKRNNKTDSFFLYLNFDALKVMVQNNLVLKIPSHNCNVKFELHMNCALWTEGQIHWPYKINYVVKKRMKYSKLNLDHFAEESDLIDVAVSMSSSNCLKYILETAKNVNDEIVFLSLRGNKISKLESLNTLSGFPKLASLDLRENDIESFENIPKLTNVIELFIDENPVCAKYHEEPWKLIRDVQKKLPNLQNIDNCRIDKTSTVFMRNYLVSANCYTLTEYFVKFFFELYDSSIRSSLRKLYDVNSLFTTSANHGSLVYDENCVDKVFVGVEKITNYFESLPQTTHDFTTIQIDVPFMTETNILITVKGVFNILSDSINNDDTIQGFTRTFFLEQQETKVGTMSNTFKYRIKNELLTIHDVSIDMKNKAFNKNVITEIEVNNICQDLLPIKSQEENAKILLLKELTQLRENWCKRLVECSESVYNA
jgi:Leucine-rich repeat (LRR) protein